MMIQQIQQSSNKITNTLDLKKIKKTYQKIPQTTRTQVISCWKDHSMQPQDISKHLNVNISTIKAIIRVYNREGRINKKTKKQSIYITKKQYIIGIYDDNVVDLIYKHAKPEERLCNIQPLEQQQDDIISILKSQNDLIVSQLGSKQIVQQYLKKVQKGEYDYPQAQIEPRLGPQESFQRIKMQLQLLLKSNASNGDVKYL